MKLISPLLCLAWSFVLFCGCGDTAGKPPSSSTDSTAAVDQGPLNLIDLSVFPRLPDAINPLMKSSTMIMYTAPGKPVDAYNKIKEQLIAERWRELPGAHLSVEYGSGTGTFEHHGYKLSLSTSRDDRQKPEGVSVTIMHHGQVDWAKLPLPADAKQDYAVGINAGYVTDSSVEDTIKNTTKSFEAAGWTLFETSPGVVEFKKGRQLIHAYISSAPAKMGKTMMQLNPKLMAADIPLPPGASDSRFHEAPAKLTFEHADSWDDMAKFYQTELIKLGWKPTTENLVKNENDAFQIYRNEEKAYLEVKLEKRSGKTAAEVEYKSAGQFAADEKMYKEAMEKKKAEKNKE